MLKWKDNKSICGDFRLEVSSCQDDIWSITVKILDVDNEECLIYYSHDNGEDCAKQEAETYVRNFIALHQSIILLLNKECF